MGEGIIDLDKLYYWFNPIPEDSTNIVEKYNAKKKNKIYKMIVNREDIFDFFVKENEIE